MALMDPMVHRVNRVPQVKWAQRDHRDLRDPKEQLEIRETLVPVSRERKESL